MNLMDATVFCDLLTIIFSVLGIPVMGLLIYDGIQYETAEKSYTFDHVDFDANGNIVRYYYAVKSEGDFFYEKYFGQSFIISTDTPIESASEKFTTEESESTTEYSAIYETTEVVETATFTECDFTQVTTE